MNELLKTQVTMSSRDIAELTGKRHDHVLRDCDVLNESYERMTQPKIGVSSYMDSTGRTLKCYELSKIQTLDLLTGYSADLRIKVNRRWEELENKNTTQLPSTYLDALKALVKSEEEKQIAQSQIKALEPKAEAFDQLMHSENSIDLSEASKVINIEGIGRNKLFKILRDRKILNDRNIPGQRFISQKYFEVIEVVKIINGKSVMIPKTLVTSKGLAWINKGLRNELNNK